MIDMTDEDKNYSFEDVLDRMRTVRSSNALYDRATTRRIMKMYFALMYETVLNGFLFIIPNFGTLYIKKGEQLGEKKKFNYIDGFKIKSGKDLQMNMKRFGFDYRFILVSEKLAKFGYKFKAAFHARKSLNKILVETNFEYRTNLI